jgi:hypothetical protein
MLSFKDLIFPDLPLQTERLVIARERHHQPQRVRSRDGQRDDGEHLPGG